MLIIAQSEFAAQGQMSQGGCGKNGGDFPDCAVDGAAQNETPLTAKFAK
jgi:hypothetical protein